MPGRPVLSEEAEKEELAERDEFYKTEAKLREMRGRRQSLVDEVRDLSSRQKEIYDARQPRQQALEATHAQHQELGHVLNDLRRRRDSSRGELDRALIALREYRAGLPKGGDLPHPEQIRREITDLEMRQQTHAVPLTEENQMIDRLRLLSRQLKEAEKNRAEVDERQRRLKELEANLAAKRAEADRIGPEMARVHAERDHKMQSMRDQLVEVGRLVADLRETSRRRGEVMARLDASNREVMTLEREADRLVRRSRDRAQEARSTVRNYNREVRETVAGEGAYARVAEAQLEELLKRGRVTLRG
jgi:uncharacterized coiled-coil DUF342 family protein